MVRTAHINGYLTNKKQQCLACAAHSGANTLQGLGNERARGCRTLPGLHAQIQMHAKAVRASKPVYLQERAARVRQLAQLHPAQADEVHPMRKFYVPKEKLDALVQQHQAVEVAQQELKDAVNAAAAIHKLPARHFRRYVRLLAKAKTSELREDLAIMTQLEMDLRELHPISTERVA